VLAMFRCSRILQHLTPTSRVTLVPTARFSVSSARRLERVSVIGSGNWGSVAARIVGQNARRLEHFHDSVKVWVYEETLQASEEEIKTTFDMFAKHHDGRIHVRDVEKVAKEVGIDMSHSEAKEAARFLDRNHDGKVDYGDFKKWWTTTGRSGIGRKLTQIINLKNENIKYLPGIKLGDNVIAEPDLFKAIEGATMLVFVTPHQFVKGLCQRLKGKLAPGTKAISLIKGMDVTHDGFELISGLISKELNIDCAVLMGANIANEIALEKFSEATVGCNNVENGKLWQELFHTPYFHVRAVQDVAGPELCGTLKNIVALGSGFVDGLQLGNNTKAAIIRIGLLEMIGLAKELFPTVKSETFFESCGIADLITTCFGGRNRKVAEAFVKSKGTKTFEDLEKELLGGQKLQGVLTSHEVQEILRKHGMERKFPLFTTIHRIVDRRIEPAQIVDYANMP